MLRLLGRHAIDVQAMDDLVPVLAEVPSPLTDPGRRVGPGVDPAVLADKVALAREAAALGIPVPRSTELPNARAFPVVVKTRTGSAGTGVRVVRDDRELRAAWTGLGGETPGTVFLQSFHDGGLVMSGGVAHRGNVIVEAVYDPLIDPLSPTGPSTAAALVRDEEVMGLTRKLVRGLGYSGFFNADWVRDASGRPLLIDFNARVFGAWPALQACGVDFIGAYLHALGVGPPPSAGTVSFERIERTLRFPLPAQRTVAAVGRQRRDAITVITTRRPWLGCRWAVVSRAKVEIATLQALARVSRRRERL